MNVDGNLDRLRRLVNGRGLTLVAILDLCGTTVAGVSATHVADIARTILEVLPLKYKGSGIDNRGRPITSNSNLLVCTTEEKSAEAQDAQLRTLLLLMLEKGPDIALHFDAAVVLDTLRKLE